jgi:putative addiction module component (TIGR02574 family)
LQQAFTYWNEIMSSPHSPVDFQHLNPSQKLDLIAQLWDSLPHSLESVPIPESHREELDRRLAAADANPDAAIPLEVYEKIQELIRLGNRAAHEAQEENRRLGIPNVYSINGVLYWELPNGELSRTDPFDKRESQ